MASFKNEWAWGLSPKFVLWEISAELVWCFYGTSGYSQGQRLDILRKGGAGDKAEILSTSQQDPARVDATDSSFICADPESCARQEFLYWDNPLKGERVRSCVCGLQFMVMQPCCFWPWMRLNSAVASGKADLFTLWWLASRVTRDKSTPPVPSNFLLTGSLAGV